MGINQCEQTKLSLAYLSRAMVKNAILFSNFSNTDKAKVPPPGIKDTSVRAIPDSMEGPIIRNGRVITSDTVNERTSGIGKVRLPTVPNKKIFH